MNVFRTIYFEEITEQRKKKVSTYRCCRGRTFLLLKTKPRKFHSEWLLANNFYPMNIKSPKIHKNIYLGLYIRVKNINLFLANNLLSLLS